MATQSQSRVPPGVFTAVFLICLGLLGFGEYIQHVLKLDPCPWCIVQRLGYIAVGLVSLTAALHRPGRGGTIFYAVLGSLFAMAGAAAAGYHIHVQNDPKRALECMGGWLEQWLDASRIGHFIPPLLQYDGSCAPKPWSFLGLSIPEWSLAWFVILLIVFIATIFAARR